MAITTVGDCGCNKLSGIFLPVIVGGAIASGVTKDLVPDALKPFDRWDNFWDLILPWRPPPVRDILERNQLQILPPPPAPETRAKMTDWSTEDLEDARARQLRLFRENPLLIMGGGKLRSDGLPSEVGSPANNSFNWELLGLGAVAGLVALAIVKRV